MAKITQKVTKSNISAEKRKAIDLYFEGKKQIEIAEALGKNRKTIHTWFNYNEGVIREINHRVREIEHYARQRASSLVGMSIDALQDVVSEGGDTGKVQAAKELLKLAGLDKVKVEHSGDIGVKLQWHEFREAKKDEWENHNG